MAIDSLRVELTLPESAVKEVREGTALEFAVSGDEGFPRQALVRYVGPAVRRSARDQVVEAIIDNRDHGLRPGLFAIARVAVGVTKLPTVPRGAVLAGDGVERVMVVDRRVVTRRVVAVEGLSSPGSVAVTSGLRAASSSEWMPRPSMSPQRSELRAGPDGRNRCRLAVSLTPNSAMLRVRRAYWHQ